VNSIKIGFRAGSFPKMLADLSHSNQFLKMFSVGSLGVSLGLLILVFVAYTRPPVVLALSPKALPLQRVEMPSPEIEVREAIQAYIGLRYNWDKDSVDRSLDLARSFVASQNLQAFSQGVANVRRFSKEKSVSQRAYATAINIDFKRGAASVLGDRISEIQGMRAAGPLNIELAFQSGPRTAENPWGIYIVKESEK
jgi:hypothetical protein